MSMPEGPQRPTIYNRPWHLDQDDRRHHGRRRWEPAAIEALVDLLSSLDGIYPPDWSQRDVVRFRSAGAAGPLAELWTDKPDVLRLVVHVSGQRKVAIEHCRIRVAGNRCEIRLTSPEPCRSIILKELLLRASAQSTSRGG